MKTTWMLSVCVCVCVCVCWRTEQIAVCRFRFTMSERGLMDKDYEPEQSIDDDSL